MYKITCMKLLKLIGKITLYGLATAFVGLFIYANWNSPRLAHSAPPSNILAYHFTKDCTIEDSTTLANTLKQLTGITAVTVNRKSHMISLAYNPSVTALCNIDDVLVQKKNLGIATETWNIDPNKPQCPVHAITPFLDNVKKALCVRKS